MLVKNMDEKKSIQDEIDEERDRLARHIAELKDRLSSIESESSAQQGHRAVQQTSLPTTSGPSTSAEKVALFMDLFRGRADVYPKRWVNTKKNTKGYSPACGNEWARGLCDKRKVKCGECPNQALDEAPVTQEAEAGHHRPAARNRSRCALTATFRGNRRLTLGAHQPDQAPGRLPKPGVL